MHCGKLIHDKLTNNTLVNDMHTKMIRGKCTGVCNLLWMHQKYNGLTDEEGWIDGDVIQWI